MSKTFRFSQDIEIGTKVSHLVVYRFVDDNSDYVYECVIDNEEHFQIAKGYQGEWYDYDHGNVTNISERLGAVIDKNEDVPQAS
jgi:hypothetical protein